MRSRFRTVLVSSLAVCALGAVVSASASAHEWKVNGKPLVGEKEVTYSGGTVMMAIGGKIIRCTSVTGKGSVKDKGAGTVGTTFTGCTANSGQCAVKSVGAPAKSGEIILTGLSTTLTERETSKNVKVLAEEVKDKAKPKEWVTLEFKGGEKACFGWFTFKVKGKYAAEVVNSTESMNFPTPELRGNTLEGFGVAMTLVGNVKQTLVGGGVLEGV
jgi:hypothetical protein